MLRSQRGLHGDGWVGGAARELPFLKGRAIEWAQSNSSAEVVCAAGYVDQRVHLRFPLGDNVGKEEMEGNTMDIGGPMEGAVVFPGLFSWEKYCR